MSAEITRKKSGSGYDTYEGVVDGRRVSIDVVCSEVDHMNDRKLETYVKQGLKAAKDYEDGKDGGPMKDRRE